MSNRVHRYVAEEMALAISDQVALVNRVFNGEGLVKETEEGQLLSHARNVALSALRQLAERQANVMYHRCGYRAGGARVMYRESFMSLAGFPDE